MKPFHFFLALVLMLLFSACEGGTTYTKIIDNQSEDDLTVRLQTTALSTAEVILIPARKSQTIYVQDFLGQFADDTYDCTTDIASIEIEVSNNLSLSLSKDPINPNNWMQESKKGKRNSTEVCTFVVRAGDFKYGLSMQT